MARIYTTVCGLHRSAQEVGNYSTTRASHAVHARIRTSNEKVPISKVVGTIPEGARVPEVVGDVIA